MTTEVRVIYTIYKVKHFTFPYTGKSSIMRDKGISKINIFLA